VLEFETRAPASSLEKCINSPVKTKKFPSRHLGIESGGLS